MDPQEEKSPNQNQKSKSYFHAHGRRKEAVARIMLYKGKGENLVNNKPLSEYFPLQTAQIIWEKPFKLTQSEGQYYATIKVSGSGKESQFDAIIQGLSKALTLANPEYRSVLKKAGLLTRDPRVKERRKYGRAQKARKGKQSPKR